MSHTVYNKLNISIIFYLKIEVYKDTKICQVYREISALRALSDLSCVPKILFEGYTVGESLALLTHFSGQPLEPPKGKGPDFLNELLEAKSLG